MDSFDVDLVERGKKCGVEVFSMREIEVRMLNLPNCFNPVCLPWVSFKILNSWIKVYSKI